MAEPSGKGAQAEVMTALAPPLLLVLYLPSHPFLVNPQRHSSFLGTAYTSAPWTASISGNTSCIYQFHIKNMPAASGAAVLCRQGWR